ncbi:class II myosin, partial [Termitomyces sp. T32_za158]
MARRIQRAFRNYMRYKHECARRIQRFWKDNKEGIAYAEVRKYGHKILAGRKERRRFSLLSYRRFMGDYLDVNGKSAFGSELASAGTRSVQREVSQLGRSSKLSPRYTVVVSPPPPPLPTTPTAFPHIASVGPVYFVEDEEINFDCILREEKIALPKGVSWTAHWLAVEGVQPLIPENPPAILRETDAVKTETLANRNG